MKVVVNRSGLGIFPSHSNVEWLKARGVDDYTTLPRHHPLLVMMVEKDTSTFKHLVVEQTKGNIYVIVEYYGNDEGDRELLFEPHDFTWVNANPLEVETQYEKALVLDAFAADRVRQEKVAKLQSEIAVKQKQLEALMKK